MKKGIALVCCLAMILCLCPVVGQAADTGVSNGFTYEKNVDNTCTLVQYNMSLNTPIVYIYKKCEDATVSNIKAGAFANCNYVKSIVVYGNPTFETTEGVSNFVSSSAITIYGDAGSNAQAFAQKTGARFVPFSYVNGLKVSKDKSLTKAKLTWDTLAGVNEYVVYRSTKKDDAVKLEDGKVATSNSFTDTGLSAGKTYYYKVAPKMVTSDGSTFIGACCNEAKVALKPAKVKKFKARAGYHVIKLSWKRDKNVSGYDLQSKSHPKIKGIKWNFCHMKTLKSNKKTRLKNVKLVSGMRYSYRIRSFVKVKGKKIYSEWSYVNKKKCK